MSPTTISPTARAFLQHMNATAKTVLRKKIRTGSKAVKGAFGKSKSAQAYFEREAARKETEAAMKRLIQEQKDQKITETMKEMATKMAELPDPTPVDVVEGAEFLPFGEVTNPPEPVVPYHGPDTFYVKQRTAELPDPTPVTEETNPNQDQQP